MTLEQLRIFVAVAEREHVTRAARDLNLTQSATSAAVAALEARYDTKLFDRVGRRIELTQAGRVFLVEARAVLARAAAAEAALTDLAGLRRGSLTIAASQTVGNYWLPPRLHAYRQAYPGVSIALTIGNTETVTAMIHDGRADLGFVEGRIVDEALEVTTVAEDELVLVAGPGLSHRIGGDCRTQLAALPWVFRERGSGTRAILEEVLAETGVAPDALRVVLELPSNESVRAAVESGAGAAVLSRLVVADALRHGTLTACDLALPRRGFFALKHRERAATPAERELFRLIGTWSPEGAARPAQDALA